MVLAGPGAGKTTLLKYTALSYIDDEVFETSKLETKKIPFFIALPDLVESKLDIVKYISEKIKVKTSEYAIEYVRRSLDKGRAAVLLDSLDEVPLSGRDQAYKLIEDFSRHYPKAKIIITCRVADYERTIPGFNEVEISRLTTTAAHKIIKAWFKKMPSKAKELIRHLSIDKDVDSLTESPLILSLLCIQYANDLNIPNRKIELYNRCMDALLRLWDTSRGFRRDTAFSSLTDERKHRLFAEVAYEFFCNKGGLYIFPDKELIPLVSSFLELFSISQDTSNATDIIKEIESHHGILERYSAESYAFSHISFQEYFVARSLVAKRAEMSFVKANISNVRAMSIIVFMIALMDDPEPVLSFLKEKSCLEGVKNYPTMSKRIDTLILLYRCMNAGVAIQRDFRYDLYSHIAKSQIEISKIYHSAKTYPIAHLDDDGIRHTYFYIDKTRDTLVQALGSHRKLSNEILLSPNKTYSEVALDIIQKHNRTNNTYVDMSTLICMVMPLSGAYPDKVIDEMNNIKMIVSKDTLLSGIVDAGITSVTQKYIQQ
ncbi:hypothetical protein K3H45_14515 [Aeromonas veronii]|uniref:NACHT domain-containing protein n=1 Tax=Aeromonas veronii TaxID=654 RepID=UPI001F17684E|nr:hypothetical protein [Aeromonas veronii]MCF5761091.1 hypothetical protein [Aeromonas veronii]